MAKRYIHIVWSPSTGPLYAYWDPTKAFEHDRAMLGTDVRHLEILDDLPEGVRTGEYEDADNTPQIPTNPAIALPRTKTEPTQPIDLGDIDEIEDDWTKG